MLTDDEIKRLRERYDSLELTDDELVEAFPRLLDEIERLRKIEAAAEAQYANYMKWGYTIDADGPEAKLYNALGHFAKSYKEPKP
jgi:hypothetical protein